MAGDFSSGRKAQTCGRDLGGGLDLVWVGGPGGKAASAHTRVHRPHVARHPRHPLRFRSKSSGLRRFALRVHAREAGPTAVGPAEPALAARCAPERLGIACLGPPARKLSPRGARGRGRPGRAGRGNRPIRFAGESTDRPLQSAGFAALGTTRGKGSAKTAVRVTRRMQRMRPQSCRCIFLDRNGRDAWRA